MSGTRVATRCVQAMSKLHSTCTRPHREVGVAVDVEDVRGGAGGRVAAARVLPRCSGAIVAFESKQDLKPVSHILVSRVETRRLSSSGSTVRFQRALPYHVPPANVATPANISGASP
jgi:hypothetical protein